MLDIRIAQINAAIDEETNQIREKYAAEVETQTRKKETAFEIVKSYASENKETLFANKRSVQMLQGVYGFRKGKHQLKLKKGYKWDQITEELKKHLPDYVRVSCEPEKAKLIADRDNEIVAGKLAMLGITVTQTESFFITRETEQEQPIEEKI